MQMLHAHGVEEKNRVICGGGGEMYSCWVLHIVIVGPCTTELRSRQSDFRLPIALHMRVGEWANMPLPNISSTTCSLVTYLPAIQLY